MNNTEIQSIRGDYQDQLYANKMDNLEEMDRFLEKFNLLRQPKGSRNYEQANCKH